VDGEHIDKVLRQSLSNIICNSYRSGVSVLYWRGLFTILMSFHRVKGGFSYHKWLEILPAKRAVNSTILS